MTPNELTPGQRLGTNPNPNAFAEFLAITHPPEEIRERHAQVEAAIQRRRTSHFPLTEIDGEPVLRRDMISHFIRAYSVSAVVHDRNRIRGDFSRYLKESGVPEDVLERTLAATYGGRAINQIVAEEMFRARRALKPVDVRKRLDSRRQRSSREQQGQQPEMTEVAHPVSNDGSRDLKTLVKGRDPLAPPRETRVAWSKGSRGFNRRGEFDALLALKEELPEAEHVEPEGIYQINTTSRPSSVIWPPRHDTIYRDRREKRTVWPPQVVWPPIIPVGILRGREPDFDYTDTSSNFAAEKNY